MKKELLIGIILVILFAIFALWPAPETDEAQIQRVMDDVETGMEKADLSLIMKQISEDYSDNQGMSKRSIRGILFQQFHKRGKLGITFSPMQIELEGEKASVAV